MDRLLYNVQLQLLLLLSVYSVVNCQGPGPRQGPGPPAAGAPHLRDRAVIDAVVQELTSETMSTMESLKESYVSNAGEAYLNSQQPQMMEPRGQPPEMRDPPRPGGGGGALYSDPNRFTRPGQPPRQQQQQQQQQGPYPQQRRGPQQQQQPWRGPPGRFPPPNRPQMGPGRPPPPGRQFRPGPPQQQRPRGRPGRRRRLAPYYQRRARRAPYQRFNNDYRNEDFVNGW